MSLRSRCTEAGGCEASSGDVQVQTLPACKRPTQVSSEGRPMECGRHQLFVTPGKKSGSIIWSYVHGHVSGKVPGWSRDSRAALSRARTYTSASTLSRLPWKMPGESLVMSAICSRASTMEFRQL